MAVTIPVPTPTEAQLPHVDRPGVRWGVLDDAGTILVSCEGERPYRVSVDGEVTPDGGPEAPFLVSYGFRSALTAALGGLGDFHGRLRIAVTAAEWEEYRAWQEARLGVVYRTVCCVPLVVE